MRKLAYLIIVLSMVSLIGGSLTGCSANVKTFSSTKSLGDQLEDLQKAFDKQAISAQEHEKAKQLLINFYR